MCGDTFNESLEPEVCYDRSDDSYYIKEKINGQTYYMAFQAEISEGCVDLDMANYCYFNIYLYTIKKRKQVNKVMQENAITGTNWVHTYGFCRKAFNALLKEVIENELPRYDKIIIYCNWLDNRRRDVYYKFLKKYGFEYAYIDGQKCIAKEYVNGNYT